MKNKNKNEGYSHQVMKVRESRQSNSKWNNMDNKGKVKEMNECVDDKVVKTGEK